MKIVLEDNALTKKQEHHIEELIKKYKKYLDAIDDWVFETRGVHLLRKRVLLWLAHDTDNYRSG